MTGRNTSLRFRDPRAPRANRATLLFSLSQAHYGILVYIHHYLRPPTNHDTHPVAHDVGIQVLPGRKSVVRHAIINPAVPAPSIAVRVMYIRSLAADDRARSAPPGSAEFLVR